MEYSKKSESSNGTTLPGDLIQIPGIDNDGKFHYTVIGANNFKIGSDYYFKVLCTTSDGTTSSESEIYKLKAYQKIYLGDGTHDLEEGDKVKQGEVIGYVGSSGLSDDPHLHYEVRKDGKPVNPQDYIKD